MLNPFLNPFNTIPLIKAYIVDPGRLTRLNSEQMKKFRDKAFRKMVKYAYTVPMYHEIYKKAGIHPRDIKGINDIQKIPMVSKNDLRENFPDRLLPRGYNKEKAHIICTGGTTGKSVSIYTDIYTMGKSLGPSIREMRSFNMNWRKSHIVHIGNFNKCRIDLVSQEYFQKPLSSFFNLDNMLNIDVNVPTNELIEKLDSFKPDYIISYPAVFQHLAYLKRKKLGKNINPTVFYSAGSILDDYTRNYVQDAFGCPLLNTYQSVEALGAIASECVKGTWHINQDFYNVEAIDDKGQLVGEGERGHIVISRLWGRGTPILRYNGMDDWIKIISNKDCDCGLSTPVIDGGVEGRKRADIVLPSGKVFPPGAFCFVEPVLTKYKSFVVKQYQVVQKKIDEIDILIVIDEDLRDIGVPVEVIKNEIRENYEKKSGPDVTINVKEVKEITNKANPRKPAPIVVTKVKLEEGYKTLE